MSREFFQQWGVKKWGSDETELFDDLQAMLEELGEELKDCDWPYEIYFVACGDIDEVTGEHSFREYKLYGEVRNLRELCQLVGVENA